MKIFCLSIYNKNFEQLKNLNLIPVGLSNTSFDNKWLNDKGNDNISEKNYPYILATTGYHDSQVQYWEPAKWVAKLRDHNNSENPIILHTNMDTGHGGASGRFKILKEVAMEYAFLIGIEKQLL